MITGTTKNGFSYVIPDTVGDDYEVLEAIAELKKGRDILSVPTLIDRVLGAKPGQKKAFMDHCRQEDGRVSTEMIMNEFFDMFNNNEATKKS